MQDWGRQTRRPSLALERGQAGFPYREPGRLQEAFLRPHAQEAVYPDGLGHRSPEQLCKTWKEDIGVSAP